MSTPTDKYLDKTITSEENRDRRKNYKAHPFANKATAFDEYEPSYGYEAASYKKTPARSFDDVDSDLSRDCNASRGKSTLSWNRARASRDAWDRLSTRR